MKKELKVFAWLAGIFLFFYFVPFSNPKISAAVAEAFRLLQWYVREHTLACVVPAMFIAGGISTFLSQASVMRYLGPKSNRFLAYTVGAVAGCILAVCSCSVLPMFAGIYAMGAGLGPGSAFLYSGPAINVMAIFLSASVLGYDLGVARVIGSIGFAYVIGLLMAFIFRHAEQKRVEAAMQLPPPPASRRNLLQTLAYFAAMVLFLVFSDWASTHDVTIALKDGTTLKANVRTQMIDTMDVQVYGADGKLAPEVKRLAMEDIAEVKPVPSFTMSIHGVKWYLAGAMGLAVLLMLWRWFDREEIKEWLGATWSFGKMIVPLLFGGVFVTGFISALIPEKAVAAVVGDNGLLSTFIASFVGMCWYFATLTEIPIVQALMKLGMAKGPALALLLAGPALSIPSILVLIKIMGVKKTLVFCALAVVMSTIVGMVFGAIV
ncbi:MAG TPA: permease [Planctomycetota bacterium]|mgnify:CR=1 FL=1|nr:permease [Planctomycetota bacterium]HRR82431.1 permease [Planctomycetota bacterium]HRT95701.1 permease [Planctomycetota bacterium]